MEKETTNMDSKDTDYTEEKAFVAAYNEAMKRQAYTGEEAETIRDLCVGAYDPQIVAEAIRSGIYNRIALAEDAEKKAVEWCNVIVEVYPKEEWVTSRIITAEDIEELKREQIQERNE